MKYVRGSPSGHFEIGLKGWATTLYSTNMKQVEHWELTPDACLKRGRRQELPDLGQGRRRR